MVSLPRFALPRFALPRFGLRLICFCCCWLIMASAQVDAQRQDAPNTSSYVQLSDGRDKPIEAETKSGSEKKKHANVSLSTLEMNAFETVNKNRAAAGLSILRLNDKLSSFARNYAEKMKKDNFFSHVDKEGNGAQERARSAGINGGIYENLGWQSGDESDLEKLAAIDKSFMDEPSGEKNHRYNLLKADHTNVGIGITRTKDQLWLVQEYSDGEP